MHVPEFSAYNIVCVLPEATMSAKPCCVSRLSSDVCGDFIVANIEDEYSAFTLVGIKWKLQYTVAVDKTSFYLFFLIFLS